MSEPCKRHKKVFANYILTSNPPQYPWVCSVCGERGTDRGEYRPIELDYDAIIKKFKEVNDVQD